MRAHRPTFRGADGEPEPLRAGRRRPAWDGRQQSSCFKGSFFNMLHVERTAGALKESRPECGRCEGGETRQEGLGGSGERARVYFDILNVETSVINRALCAAFVNLYLQIVRSVNISVSAHPSSDRCGATAQKPLVSRTSAPAELHHDRWKHCCFNKACVLIEPT